MFTSLLISLLAASTPADGDLLAEAESAFLRGLDVRDSADQARGDFLRAANGYRELRRRGYRNADLLGNEGNAFLLAGDVPQAIFAYRLGLHLEPANRMLAANLAFAREQVSYVSPGPFARPPVGSVAAWLTRPSANTLLLLAFVAYAMSWLLLTRWLMIRKVRLLPFAAVSLAITICLSALLVLKVFEANRNASQPPLVIAVDDVVLRKGNGMTYAPRSETPLNRGVEARLLFVKGDWLQIELGSGEVGWIPCSSALLDELPQDL